MCYDYAVLQMLLPNQSPIRKFPTVFDVTLKMISHILIVGKPSELNVADTVVELNVAISKSQLANVQDSNPQ